MTTFRDQIPPRALSQDAAEGRRRIEEWRHGVVRLRAIASAVWLWRRKAAHLRGRDVIAASAASWPSASQETAIRAHLRNCGECGDALAPGCGGTCPPDAKCRPDDNGACRGEPFKITVCHKGKKTLSVSAAAVAAHLAHGDSLGACSR